MIILDLGVLLNVKINSIANGRENSIAKIGENERIIVVVISFFFASFFFLCGRCG
ncbi:hypothetical protein KKC91_03040 [bacterium]|nr:hypothetical protein [bacterium]